MLFKTKTREIEARVFFDERQKRNLNLSSSINPNLNKKVTIRLCMRFATKTSMADE